MAEPNNSLQRKQDDIPLNAERWQKQFAQDTAVIAEQTALFVQAMHPAYLATSKENALRLTYKQSDTILDAFTFFRLHSCKTEKADELFDTLSNQMERFYTAIHSLNAPVVYGVISFNGNTNLVIGIYDQKNDADVLKSVLQGLLEGIEISDYKPHFSSRDHKEKSVGLISSVPSLKIEDKKLTFELAPLIRSLNGQNYTLLFVSRPVGADVVAQKYGELIGIRDNCFAVSKRNLSHQYGTAHAEGESDGETKTHSESTSTAKTKGHSSGLSIIIANIGWNRSKTETKQESDSVAKSLTKTVTDTINRNDGISSDVQNGFALELMDYADKAIDRLRQGRSNGMWETVISYSADSEIAAGIMQACIEGELSKPNPDVLPLASIQFNLSAEEAQENSMLIPKIVMGESEMSQLCTAITSEELGFISTPPTTVVPDFEVKQGKAYPLVSHAGCGIEVGKICDGNRPLDHMGFNLTPSDLVKHTFVCGITGSGKTTTVKNILRNADVPFLVIESAKKEYRNIRLDGNKKPAIYTLGKPEINCLRFNPFYIQCGISPQMHIDYLKDLFNASFSFYGPMPYILEKCLQNVYVNKGWNLTLGFHPMLANTNNSADFFEADYMKEQYSQESHKYLFPTMQDLKAEVERYIEKEMQYEGEVAGNIKTAIRARLEGLCSGSKGYMFNTTAYADMEHILESNAVFELEGLADDADKAFCVGLLIIFINEYRQIHKELDSTKSPLSHLLVIEEAHRLLKNVSVERNTEDMGNPKGKAVEHFTNMIAEMRSYGQGVIIAEQIPSKLAPDVIKNTSNKIIQRIVAADDQEIIANTVGMKQEDAVYLGSLLTGYALCHKEGMSLPTTVKIPESIDDLVSDGQLYQMAGAIDERVYSINCGIVREALSSELDLAALRLLNTILTEEYTAVENAITHCRKRAASIVAQKSITLIPSAGKEVNAYASVLTEAIIVYLIHGVYCAKSLITDELALSMQQLITKPDKATLKKVKDLLKEAYMEDPAYKAKHIISQLIQSEATKQTNIPESIKAYFADCEETTIQQIVAMIKEV